MTSLKKNIQAILFVALLPSSLLAWGEKGHTFVNSAAMRGAPSEMPRFFHDAYPQLVYLGYDPDRDEGSGRAAYVADYADHFLDLEYVEGVEFPQTRYQFIDRLVAARVFSRYRIGSVDVGYLPYRITELSEQIEQQWWLWKRSDAANRPHIERNIIQLSGILGHFVADAGNPHHTTIHYNGWLGENSRGYANDCAIHARFESDFVNRAVDLPPVVERLRDPQRVNDYAKSARQLIDESHAQLIQLYELDRVGAFGNRGTIESRTFVAERMASSASLLRDLWWSAYRKGIERP